MRRLLPLALLLVACSKPETSAPVAVAPTVPPKAATMVRTPGEMAKAMDVPLYPGAEAPQGMSLEPETRGDGSTHYSLVLATKDSPEKVARWYASELSMEAMPGMGGHSVVGKTKKGNDLILTAAPEAGRTLVRIKTIAYPQTSR